MSNGTPDTGIKPLDDAFRQLSEEVWSGWDRLHWWEKIQRVIEVALRNFAKWVVKFVLMIMAPFGVAIAEGLIESESALDPSMSRLTKATVRDLFGADIGTGRLRDSNPETIGSAVLEALTGDALRSGGGTLEPSLGPAKNFIGRNLALGMEGWFKGALAEVGSFGQLETFGGLDDMLAANLGLGRASRTVMRPILEALVAQPAEWHINKTYRPRLLSYFEVARQVARGRMTREEAHEELARQGYTDKRIDALLNAASKFLSVADVDLLVRVGEWSEAEALGHLQDQGYDEGLARHELLLERLKRIASFERSMANAAIDAYADRRIDRADLVGFLDGVTIDRQEQAQLAEIADTRRLLRVRRLSSGQVEAMVKSRVAAMIDYRRALEREGYPPDDVAMLELQLRWELDKEAGIEEARRRQAEERAAEKVKRDEERARKLAEAEAARALARRGREADLERAVIRGRIPIARYVEVIAPLFDADTVEIMVDEVETARQAYLDEQRARADAEKRARVKRIDVGSVRAAVLRGVLTLDEFRRHPALQALEPADRDILAKTLEAELADRQLAEERKREAEQRAKQRGIDLGRLAALVRRGIRTIEDYRARVAELFTNPADVDAIVELLELELEEAARAEEERRRAALERPPRALSVEQLRGLVLRGVAPIARYEQALIEQRFTVEAQELLMRDLRRELEEVEAARQRQAEAAARSGSRELPLSVVQRAARLGVVPPDLYIARLAADGLDELDQQIALELLLLEIAETQQARTMGTAASAAPPAGELPLDVLRLAVIAGQRSIEEYRAAAVRAGLEQTDVSSLVAVVADEIAQRRDADAVRERVHKRAEQAGINLAGVERAVLEGAAPLEDFERALANAKVSALDVQILIGRLVSELEAAGA